MKEKQEYPLPEEIISKILFSDDFMEYDLELMSDHKEIKGNILYIKFDQKSQDDPNVSFAYTVKSPDGVLYEDNISIYDILDKIPFDEKKNFNCQFPLTIKQLKMVKEYILEITSRRGHTYSIAKDILTIMSLSRRWLDISRKNTTWEPLFIKRFAYSPTSYVWDSPVNSFSFFSGYQKQLLLTQVMAQEKGTQYSRCEAKELVKAVQTKNIPLIYALLHTSQSHEIEMTHFAPSAEDLIKYMTCFISQWIDLPLSLLMKLMEYSFDTHGIDSDTGLFPHEIIVYFADAELLRKFFKKLLTPDGNDQKKYISAAFLSSLIEPRSFWHTLGVNFSVARFQECLNIFEEILGKKKLCEFIMNWLTMHRDDDNVFHNSLFQMIKHNKVDYFAMVLTFFDNKELIQGTQQHKLLLLLLVRFGSSQFLTHFFKFWGDETSNFIKTKVLECEDEQQKKYKISILRFMLINPDSSVLALIRETLGEDFREWLHEVGHEMFFGHGLRGGSLRKGLQLLKEYNLLYIAREHYMESGYLIKEYRCDHPNENLYEQLFAEFDIIKSSNNFCSIL